MGEPTAEQRYRIRGDHRQEAESLSFVQAVSVPVGAVTAWQMLFQYGQAVPRQRVLIQGAAGNVGAYAVQMARSAGLEIFGTAADDDLDYVRAFGAQTAIDYQPYPLRGRGAGCGHRR